MRKLQYVFLIILLLAGCKGTAEETEPEIMTLQRQEWLNKKLKIHEDMMTVAYDTTLLKEWIQQEIDTWNKPEKTITFSIQNSLNKVQHVVGLFHSPTDWELSGRLDDQKTFKMTNQDESVTLEYDHQKHTLSLQEFSFLLPQHHLKLVQETLQNQNYKYLAWEKGNKNWEVTLETPMRSLSEDIASYLSHGEEQAGGANQPLVHYSVTYSLIFSGDSTFHLEQITFSVETQKELLDQLTFNLSF